MGLKDWLGIGTEISKPIEAIGDLYTTDKARIEAEAKLTEADAKYKEIVQKPQLAQLETNHILAMSANFFNSGWPSMLGWTCGFLILMYYLPQIIIVNYVWGVNCIDTGIVKPFPMKPDDLLNLVYLLFGFGSHHLIKNGLNK